MVGEVGVFEIHLNSVPRTYAYSCFVCSCCQSNSSLFNQLKRSSNLDQKPPNERIRRLTFGISALHNLKLQNA